MKVEQVESLEVIEEHLENARKNLDVAGEELQALIIDNMEAKLNDRYMNTITQMKNHVILALNTYDKFNKKFDKRMK